MFTRERKVRFGDVDYAGIIFYPRYFEALNGIVEDWFADAVGQSFKFTHDTYGIATPLVALETEFVKPSSLDEILTYTLSVKRLGPSSITFHVETSCDGETRMQSTLTHVCAKAGVNGAIAWPDEMGAKLRELSGENA